MDIQSSNDQAQKILSNLMGIRGLQIFPQDAMQDPFPGKISFFLGGPGDLPSLSRQGSCRCRNFFYQWFLPSKILTGDFVFLL